MLPYRGLDTPAVIVDLDTMEANLASMAARARAAGVKLRPHAKTHKSIWIAGEQLRHGASGLTVAKLGEAEVLAPIEVRQRMGSIARRIADRYDPGPEAPPS